MTANSIDTVYQKAKTLKAMVIGDAMVDRYIYGTVDRISPEAPVPILSHQRSEVKAGGAANVALNLAAWGCDTILAGITGNDSNADLLADMLTQNKIRHHLFISPDRPTTVKTRVVAASHHLLRIDEESNEYLTGDEEERAIEHLLSHISSERPDLIILEDYNKGFLTEKIITRVIGKGREIGVFIAVDPKEKNFFSYRGVNLFKPNLREASQAAHKSLTVSDLHETGLAWREKIAAQTLAITLGANGIFLQQGNDDVHVLPHKAIDVIDVCGAGDAVICALALGIMSGLDLNSCGTLANVTGAYVCSHSGVVAVDVETIHQWI